LPSATPTPGLPANLEAWDRLRRPIWLFDPISCRGLYANAAAIELWGAASREELLARDFSELSPAVRTRVERLALATANGESVTERWSFYPQGRPVTVQAMISSFALDDGRVVLLFEAAPVDVEAEELRAVEALRHTSILITLFDPKGRPTFTNPAAFAAYGEAAPGFEARFGDGAPLARVLAGQAVTELRRMPGEDGGERWRHLDARRVTDPVTGQWGVLLSERDVTEQIEAERALAAAHERAEVAEAKQRFLANISHELRTPLNAVTGFAGLLAATDLDDTQARRVAHIAEAGQQLTRIVNDVIDLAELDGAEVRLEVAPFDPATLVEDALETVRLAAEAKGLALGLELPPTLPGLLLGDAGRLGKVLAHLLDNAVKFTERGGVTLRLESRDIGVRCELTLLVTDTGPGLDDEAQTRLFRRFSQGDDSVRKSVGGGGLGLAVARELMTLMGGEVGVQSTPGRGARFWLRLSLEHSAIADQSAQAAISTSEGQGGVFNVLYADDNATNRALVQAILQSQGHRCDLVCDGAEAVAAVRDGGYDLVLMDIQMPIMDGVSAAREIRRLALPHGAVPILALTANTLTDQLDDYAAAGMADCIAKPVNMAELIAKTAQWAAAGRALAPPTPAVAANL